MKTAGDPAPTKLLVVDDSNMIRTHIARLCADPRLPPIEVVALARNGLAAVSLFNTHHPAIVTMDLTMPEMDGLQCTERLMQLDPAVGILVISALSDKATAIKALKKGARGFLYKPFTDEQLLSALQQMIKHSGKRA